MNCSKTSIGAVLLLAVSTTSLPALAATASVEQRIASLEAQLAELQALVANQGLAQAEQIEQARPVPSGTRFRYGGFVQLDAIASDFSEGRPSSSLIEDFVVPSLTPVASGSQADSYRSLNLHAKSSRFFFTTRTATAAGDVSTRIELDFMLSAAGDERISNSWNPRLRHAFVKWDYAEGRSLLAGQSWSTFFNVGALPDLLDFVGPVGTIFERQPQLRWTLGNWQLAVENPATRLNQWDGSAASTRLDDAETLPDLIARYNGRLGDLSWSAAAMARRLQYELRSGSAREVASDEQFGYGLSLAGKWQLGEDDLRLMVNYGSALGRYMGLNVFNDGYIDAEGNIETVDQWGAFAAYSHHWTPRWRSTFALSAAAASNPSAGEFGGAGSLASDYQTLHANLNWLPAPGLQLGGEFSYGRKELEDGRDGDFNRLQFAVKYAF